MKTLFKLVLLGLVTALALRYLEEKKIPVSGIIDRIITPVRGTLSVNISGQPEGTSNVYDVILEYQVR